MAVWSIIRYKKLFPRFNIASEHYHPDKLKMLESLRGSKGVVLREIAPPVREIWDPSNKTGNDLKIYDLGAARKHILQVEDAQEEERVSTKKVSRNGDIVVSRLRSYLEQVAYVPNSMGKIYISTEFIVLRSKQENIAFLVPFLLSKPVQTILRWSQDGSEHPRFNEKVLLDLNIPEKVLKLADILNSYITQAEKALVCAKKLYIKAENLLLEELGLYDLDLSQELYYEQRYSEAKESRRIDAEYFKPKYNRVMTALKLSKPKRIVRLNELLVMLTNGHTPLRHDLSEGDVPFLTAEHVFDFRIEYDSEKRILLQHHTGELKRTILKDGDCLITIKGKIGNAAIAENVPGNVNINQDVALFRLNEIVPSYYLMGYLNSPVGKTFIEQYCTGQINPFLGLGNVRLLPVPVYEAKRMSVIAEKTKRIVIEAADALEQSRRILKNAIHMVEDGVLKGAK